MRLRQYQIVCTFYVKSLFYFINFHFSVQQQTENLAQNKARKIFYFQIFLSLTFGLGDSDVTMHVLLLPKSIVGGHKLWPP